MLKRMIILMIVCVVLIGCDNLLRSPQYNVNDIKKRSSAIEQGGVYTVLEGDVCEIIGEPAPAIVIGNKGCMPPFIGVVYKMSPPTLYNKIAAYERGDNVSVGGYMNRGALMAGAKLKPSKSKPSKHNLKPAQINKREFNHYVLISKSGGFSYDGLVSKSDGEHKKYTLAHHPEVVLFVNSTSDRVILTIENNKTVKDIYTKGSDKATVISTVLYAATADRYSSKEGTALSAKFIEEVELNMVAAKFDRLETIVGDIEVTAVYSKETGTFSLSIQVTHEK